MAESELRDALETSRRGAPASGEAVVDIFSVDEIFLRIMATADDELTRSHRMLFLSGLTAGLLIGLTLLGHAILPSYVPGAQLHLVGAFLYPIGFIAIVIGRHQLFTENTLTPVTLVLTRLASLPRLLSLWGLVYVANLLGAVLAAGLFAKAGILEPGAVEVARHLGEEAMAKSWAALLSKAVIAGWIVAGMVWLVHAVRESIARLAIVYLLMFLIPVFGLYHCISSACEISYYVAIGGATAGAAIAHFVAPVTIGNVIGGVLFVALPHYFQTHPDRFRTWSRLGWREWLFGSRRETSGSDQPIMQHK